MKKLIILLSFLPLFSWGQSYGTNSDGFPVYFMRNGRANFAVSLTYNRYLDSLLNYTTGSYTPVQLNALDKLADTLEYYKVFDSLDVFYLHAMDNMHDAMLNWKSTSLSNTYNGTMIDSVIFYPHIGFRRAQYTGSINSNFNPTTAGGKYTLNSASVGFYDYDNRSQFATGYAIASNSGASNWLSFGYNLPNHTFNNWTFNSTLANVTVNAITPTNLIFKGTVNIIRTSSTNLNVFTGQTKYTRTNNTSGGGMPNRPIYIGSQNNNGTNASTDRMLKSASWIGGQLTDLQAQKMDLALERYRAESMQFYDLTWETPSFYYKTPNSAQMGYCYDILSVNGNYRLAFNRDTLYYSVDNGVTFPYKKYFVDSKKWTSAYIYSTGIFWVATSENQIWVSKDSLTTFTQLTVENPDGTNYTFHTPTSVNYKGGYFVVNQPAREFTLNGKLVSILPSYSSVALGASPSNIYVIYGCDSVKVQYRGGQNLSYRDNGTPSGSNSTGTILGVAWNPLINRHWHSAVEYNDTIYACGGDTYTEIFWIRGIYNAAADSFTWKKIINGYTSPTVWDEFKSVGLYVMNDTAYFGNDGNTAGHFGLYKMALTDTASKGSIKIYDSGTLLFINAYFSPNYIFATSRYHSVYSSDYINFSKISTSETHYVSDGNYYTYTNIMEPTSDNWITMYTNGFPTIAGEGTNVLWHAPSVMIKPK